MTHALRIPSVNQEAARLRISAKGRPVNPTAIVIQVFVQVEIAKVFHVGQTPIARRMERAVLRVCVTKRNVLPVRIARPLSAKAENVAVRPRQKRLGST